MSGGGGRSNHQESGLEHLDCSKGVDAERARCVYIMIPFTYLLTHFAEIHRMILYGK